MDHLQILRPPFVCKLDPLYKSINSILADDLTNFSLVLKIVTPEPNGRTDLRLREQLH